jgi:hypothetical protein
MAASVPEQTGAAVLDRDADRREGGDQAARLHRLALPGVLDLDATRDAVDAAEEAGKGKRVLVVLNKIDARRADLADAVEATEKRFGRTPFQVHQRAAYQRALIVGRSGAEIDKACAKEVTALWTEVRKILGS